MRHVLLALLFVLFASISHTQEYKQGTLYGISVQYKVPGGGGGGVAEATAGGGALSSPDLVDPFRTGWWGPEVEELLAYLQFWIMTASGQTFLADVYRILGLQWTFSNV
jgi:hypothetical protein